MTAKSTQVPPITFLCVARTLTIPEIPRFAAEEIDNLMHHASSIGLKINDPLHFLFHDCDGDVKKEFLLEIAVPVPAGTESAGRYYSKSSPGLNCFSLEYKGPMKTIGHGWMALIEQMHRAGHKPGSESREIYRQWVEADSPDNVTELQQEIA